MLTSNNAKKNNAKEQAVLVERAQGNSLHPLHPSPETSV
jgi:hypothetical protein